ncbi:MAG: phosphoglycerate kinase [Candidatus Thermoplasmatota archaeon]|nr:phosphoglycerate kinase [Euryarchaeota archaeon]MBU4031262.1 phosphoglycerate kinase [Candidatus Thermoplasmatota archaeon]MBU4070728.1 phosphoglycerate kinase [Candidatus Thermoplasmatota archaeon]MBU4144965.1 phosphoglycerate kinase [Candidatus Thermoplasmatota archaeon]MBU4592057.1 phosphoglycerate kinase [Candidatus Thermoplasmatota archaeon]
MADNPFYTLDDFDFDGKTVLLRLDINSPIDPTTMNILDDTRIRAVLPTIQDLGNAKIVILAHQSKPGKSDFTPLKEHGKILANLLGRKVTYVDSLFDTRALDTIKAMKPWEIILLENTRFYSEDVALKDKKPDIQARSHIVQRLSSVADYYVCEAFAAAHRSQPTLIGFAEVMPAIAGRLMESELCTLGKLLTKDDGLTAILGGTKVDDSLNVLKYMLENNMLAQALTGGLVANLFLKAEGYDLGKASEDFMEKEIPELAKMLEEARALMDRYPDKIQVPVDLGLNNNGERLRLSIDELPAEFPIHDIGLETTVDYIDEIMSAERCMLNGPMGVFELDEFDFGTLHVLKAMTESECFSVVGGGHTAAAVEKFGLRSQMDHVSTGGGALINFLTGKELPVVEALKRSKARCEKNG